MLFQKSLIRFGWLILFVIAVNTIAVRPAYSEDVPLWFKTAAATKIAVYDKSVSAVVLHKEQIVDVNSNGQVSVTTNFAVRLLSREGKEYAVAAALYLQSASKVRDIKAWLIRPNGTTKSYGKDSVVDLISNPKDIYDEYRLKLIKADSEAEAGAVFGYTSVIEEQPLFAQDRWEFQDNLPTLLSRYTLNLPKNWQASSVTFNHAELKPQVSGSTYIWELRDLQHVPLESDSPKFHALVPRININYFEANARASVYKTWADVSTWYTDLSEPSVTVDDAVASKARELTANAKTELEKIRAVGNFVQNLQYISVDIGVARGGGHRPRPANLVLQRGYGDCKDKANLMRAMLRALKIEAYPILIFAGDPTYVRAEWSSPRQFNHCIIAVKISSETNAPTVITDEKLGRLLIFDATDPYTLVGDLPDHEQGSFALVAAGPNGNLLKMPILPPEASRLERTAEAALLPDGSLEGTIREQAYGQTASGFRGESRTLSAAAYKTQLESWLTNRMAGAKISKVAPNDRAAEGRFDLDINFATNNYAQVLQNRLMIFKPAFVGRLDHLVVTEGKRQHPVLLDASAYSETIKVRLPEGFVVDEMPEANNLETTFGKYAVSYEVKDGFLLFNRKLTVNKTTLPAENYDSLKNFFAKVRAAEHEPIVLVRK